MNIMNMLKTVAQVILIIGFIFFEEFIWKTIAVPAGNYLRSLKVLEKVQVWIEAQNTYTTLVIFIVPLIIAELMGLQSGVLFVTGSMIAGIILYIIKIPVAAVTFWIFSFSKDQLLTIDWFKTLYDLLIRFLDFVKSTSIYRNVKLRVYVIKKKMKLAKEKSQFRAKMKRTYGKLTEIFKDEKLKA